MPPQGSQFPDERSDSGEFERQEDAFRMLVADDGSSPHPPEAGRYHLYVSLACPWAHRTLVVRRLKALEDAVGATAVDPVRDERGWAFRKGAGHGLDPINGFAFLKEVYLATDPGFDGRVTVPVLWDRVLGRIVNNSEGYLKDLYQQPGIAETVDFDHIKRHYYVTHDEINPSGIVPLGPILDLGSPHGRARIGT